MKTIRPLIVVTLFITLAGMAHAKPKGANRAIALMGLSEHWVTLAQMSEPDLLDVERAALDRAQLTEDPSHEWRKKSRLSAALPLFSVGVETGYLNRANFNVQDSIAVNSTGVTIGPEANNLNQYATNQTMFTARATWALPDTVFHRQTLAIDRELRAREVEREKLSERVSTLYYERLHLKSVLMATRRHPRRYPMDRVAVMTALQKATGELDVLTNGWFGDQLKGVRS